jgi:hypothetical protein
MARHIWRILWNLGFIFTYRVDNVRLPGEPLNSRPHTGELVDPTCGG